MVLFVIKVLIIMRHISPAFVPLCKDASAFICNIHAILKNQDMTTEIFNCPGVGPNQCNYRRTGRYDILMCLLQKGL